MTRPWIKAIAMTAAGLISAGLGLWTRSHGGSITLSSGARLDLETVKLGLDASHYFGSVLTRLAQKLPPGLQQHLPRGQKIHHFCPETNMVFLLTLDRPDPLLAPTRSLSLIAPAASKTSQGKIVFTLQSDGGTQYDLPGAPSIHTLTDGRCAIWVASPAWPRASKAVRLNVFQPGPNQHLQPAGTWKIVNPIPAAIPSWTRDAVPLPMTREVKGVKFTLHDFELRPMPGTRGYPPWTNCMEPTGFLRFHVATPPDQAPAPFHPVEVRLQDVHGNGYRWRNDFNGSVEADDYWSCGIKLPWPGDGLPIAVEISPCRMKSRGSRRRSASVH